MGFEMNANELAVELEHYLKGEEYDRLVWEIPDLLRQQQEKLTKYELRHAEQRKRIEELEAKTLTDEEIEQIGKEYGIKSVYQFAYYEFARAILRKAQEK